ncbi:MAG: hypothetical protein SGI92_25220 [Bryobacteraceae bacterium]|nr:hypothetical protein [Bryobacteraceae bacterium]
METNSCDLANLAQYNDLYASSSSASDRGTNMENIPDGLYDVEVERVEYQPPSRLYWHFRITSGAFSGQLLCKYRPISERTIPWIREDLEKCAMHLDVFSDLPGRLYELAGRSLTVSKRTRPDTGFVNIYLQQPQNEDSGHY